MAEIDVRRTRDGVFVLSHSPYWRQITIIDRDWEDLASVDIGGGHLLGRFEDLLARAGDYPLNVEIKNWPEQPDFDASFNFANQVAALCRQIDLITCFHWPTIHAVRVRHPDRNTGLLAEHGWDVAYAIAQASEHGHSTVVLHHSLISSDPLAVVDQAGELEVYVFTVNDFELGIRLADAKVDGVITDDPAAMVRAFADGVA
jgi:glycerophosphoryl diester phosphodiesterase